MDVRSYHVGVAKVANASRSNNGQAESASPTRGQKSILERRDLSWTVDARQERRIPGSKRNDLHTKTIWWGGVEEQSTQTDPGNLQGPPAKRFARSTPSNFDRR